MTGIHLGKGKRRVASRVTRERNRAGQRVLAAGCVYGVKPGLPQPICSLSEMEVRKREGAAAPKPLTMEQSNCFKMVSPTVGCAFN